MSAWAAAEWITAAFSYWELSCPKRVSEYQAGFGPYSVSADQRRAFEALVASVLPTCRPGSLQELGRGQRRLVEALSSFELTSLHDKDPFGRGVTTAKPVDISRVSLPTRVGSCDPAQWVPPQSSWVLSDPSRLISPQDEWPDPLPVPCHMIDPKSEIAVSKQLDRIVEHQANY